MNKKIQLLACILLVLLAFSCRKKEEELAIAEGKITLKSNLIDAEYSKKNDLLIYVSTNPHQLNVYNTLTNKLEIVGLGFAPMSVSIALDGKTAIVGHDARVSHVDLTKLSVTKVYDVTCEAFDVVLGSNGWAYVLPKRDQWSNIHCLNLSTGEEILSTGYSIYAGSKGKLHPSGKYLYVTNNGLSPSDIEKFDLREGAANRMYDSPYHGDYPISGDLWFSEDGNRIFVKGRTVLKASEIKSQDMVYNGTVSDDTLFNGYYNYRSILSLDHSQVTNTLYYIVKGERYDSSTMPFVYINNATNLDITGKLELEKYAAVDNTGKTVMRSVEPLFVFINSRGSRVYVITKAEKEVNKSEWKIQIF